MLFNSIRLLLVLSLGIMGFTGCESLDGLEPVTGMTGRIEFQGAWPDSITAAALVILEQAAFFDQDNIGNYLITYTNPDTVDHDYFVQLPSGGYIGVVVGLTVDPGLFAVNVDKYLSAPVLPLVTLTDPLETGISQLIPKEGVLEKNWLVSFDLGP